MSNPRRATLLNPTANRIYLKRPKTMQTIKDISVVCILFNRQKQHTFPQINWKLLICNSIESIINHRMYPHVKYRLSEVNPCCYFETFMTYLFHFAKKIGHSRVGCSLASEPFVCNFIFLQIQSSMLFCSC